jgi:hypothetical protein
LRGILARLEKIHSHVVVCHQTVVNQNADSDPEVAEVLRISVSYPIDALKIRLARLAARCDGGPVGEEYADADEPEGGS